MTASLRFIGREEPIEVTGSDESILDLAIKTRLPHLHECGGNGICTTCRVRVLFGADGLSELTDQEKLYRIQRNWPDNIRLACQTRIDKGDVLVEKLINNSAEITGLQVETVPVGIGEEKDLVILFCDMRNFTPLTERQTNFDMAHILNRFFTVMGDSVIMNNGLIYQYAGDEIIALFGIGSDNLKKAADDAARAAIGMSYAVERLNRWDLKHFDAKIDIGVGLHMGRLFIGNVGHPQHKQFAIIGDAVNITSRIQHMNRDLETRILVSQALLDVLPEDTLFTGKKSHVNLKGKSEPFDLYEVKGFQEFDPNLEVQSTIDVLLRDEAGFARRFYDRLFERDPGTRALFSDELEQQGMLLTHMLRGLVHALSRPGNLVAGLKHLGEQHMGYGIQRHHFDLVREVLKEVVAEQLGDEYTEYREKAWNGTIDFILDEMQQGYD